MYSGFTEMRWMKSRSRKEYSKIKFDTVSLCDNVKMAKAKDEEAARERSCGGFFVEERRWTDAEKTEEAVCLSGLSQPYGREILSGTPEQGEQ